MLTLSFIHNLLQKKKNIKPKTMDRKTKAFTGFNFQAKKHPPQKALCAKI